MRDNAHGHAAWEDFLAVPLDVGRTSVTALSTIMQVRSAADVAQVVMLFSLESPCTHVSQKLLCLQKMPRL